MSDGPPERDARIATLEDLVRLRKPVGEAIRAAGNLGWDSADDIVVLTVDDAVRAVRRYMDGSLSGNDFENWAEALTGRDDVGFDPRHADVLKQFLFEVSTPELFEPLGGSVARTWCARLDAAAGRSTE